MGIAHSTLENRILYITLLVSLIIAIIIIYFFVSIIRYHRRYMRLQREKIFAEITIRENERKRIAGDLHDSLGPLLSAVKLNISSVDIETTADREILELAWLEGKGPAEIATVLKITNNNASQRLGRARERFMKLCPDYLRGQEGARHD